MLKAGSNSICLEPWSTMHESLPKQLHPHMSNKLHLHALQVKSFQTLRYSKY